MRLITIRFQICARILPFYGALFQTASHFHANTRHVLMGLKRLAVAVLPPAFCAKERAAFDSSILDVIVILHASLLGEMAVAISRACQAAFINIRYLISALYARGQLLLPPPTISYEEILRTERSIDGILSDMSRLSFCAF